MPHESHALEALMAHHERLDALFLEHQTALVGLEVARARDALARYRAALLAHMTFEETRILPQYALLPPVRGGGADMFLGEHEKLRRLLASVEGIVVALRTDAADVREHAVRAFDRAATFKALLEHHDTRERELLYPRLAMTLAPHEATALVAAAPVPP